MLYLEYLEYQSFWKKAVSSCQASRSNFKVHLYQTSLSQYQSHHSSWSKSFSIHRILSFIADSPWLYSPLRTGRGWQTCPRVWAVKKCHLNKNCYIFLHEAETWTIYIPCHIYYPKKQTTIGRLRAMCPMWHVFSTHFIQKLMTSR